MIFNHIQRSIPEVALGWDFSGIPNPISQIPGFSGFFSQKNPKSKIPGFFGIFGVGILWDFYPRLFEKIPWDWDFFSWDGKSHKIATSES